MRTIWLFVLVVLLWAGGASAAETPAPSQETTYDRVLRTGVLRCGYINYPPHFIIDPTTGQKSGISFDLMNEAARLLSLKVEWVEELGWGNTVTALQSSRVDAICTSFWQNPVEGRYLGFTMPLFYSAVGAYVRATDTRFDTDLTRLNAKDVRISVGDGNIAALIAQQTFPRATLISLPNMTDETMQLEEVKSGKADVTFIETQLGETYAQKNEGAVRNLVPAQPLRVFGNTFALPIHDTALKSMLDSALVQLLNGGFVEQTLQKYETVTGGIYRTAKPYRMP